LLSSVFDFLTFAALLLVVHADAGAFRSGWFVESVVSASLAVLVIRTPPPLVRSRPGRGPPWATLARARVNAAPAWTQVGRGLGFAPLPLRFYGLLGAIVALYVVSAELVKRRFYGHPRS